MLRALKVLMLVAVLTAVPTRAWAIPTTDGFWTSANADGYTLYLENYVDSPSGNTSQGVLGLAIDGSYLYVMFAQQTSVNDNSYGTNKVGWTGSNHNSITELADSESATFIIKRTNNTTAFDRSVDYLNCTASLGQQFCDENVNLVTSGGTTGSVGLSRSSLQWNLNNTPLNCGQFNYLGVIPGAAVASSPAADTAHYNANEANTSPASPCNVAGPDWMFPTIWELRIDLSTLTLGTTTLATIRTLIDVTTVVNSPVKGADTNACDDAHFSGAPGICGNVPEPASLLLVGTGVAAFAVALRRRKAA